VSDFLPGKDDPDDLDRMIEAVELSRKIGQSASLSDIIEFEVAPGKSVMDRKALRDNVASNVAAYLHPTSTVPMGADSDPTSVVDAWGKVHGVERLRVVDASILPEIPSAPTNATTIMVAERMTERITAGNTELQSVKKSQIGASKAGQLQ
jgi:choline dehydrogenase